MIANILEHFPNFDYRSPLEPWRVDITQTDNLADLQIQAFHYYWTTEATKHGTIGLSLVTPNLPFCFTVSVLDYPAVHCRKSIFFAHEGLQPQTFSCVVASAPISEVPCVFVPTGADKKTRSRKQCQGTEVLQYLHWWGALLIRGGVMIGVLFDNHHARTFRKTNLIEELNFQHAWTADSFREHVIEPFLRVETDFVLEEYDTLKNNLAFNFVLRRR